MHNVEPAAYRLQALNPGANLCGRQPVVQSNRRTCQRIQDHMHTRYGNLGGKAALFCMNLAGNPVKSLFLNPVRIYRILFSKSKKYRENR